MSECERSGPSQSKSRARLVRLLAFVGSRFVSTKPGLSCCPRYLPIRHPLLQLSECREVVTGARRRVGLAGSDLGWPFD